MKGILLGAAIGYVLGARAGRERYDQLVRAYRKAVDHPLVQGAAGVVRAKVGELTGEGRHR
jgi:membrane protein DedA with SNARE-associated domain